MQRTLTGNRKPVDISSFSDAELKEACTVFSEGNEQFAKVLYKLNMSGFKTFASCAGHENKNGYVAFYFNESNLSKVALLIESLSPLEINFIIHNVKSNYHEASILKISIPNEKREEVYNTILSFDKNNLLPVQGDLYYILKIVAHFRKVVPKYEFEICLYKEENGYAYSVEEYFKPSFLVNLSAKEEIDKLYDYPTELNERINNLKEIADRLEKKVKNRK